MTEESKDNNRDNTDVDVDFGILCELHLVEETCKAEDGEGYYVVKENTEHQSRGGLAVREDVCARYRLHKLGERVDEAGCKTCARTVLDADKHHGEHTCDGY